VIEVIAERLDRPLRDVMQLQTERIIINHIQPATAEKATHVIS
jgi:hypothetical protein